MTSLTTSAERDQSYVGAQVGPTDVQSEVSAISSVLTTLSGLTDESREKVLRSVSAYFGVGAAQTRVPQQASYRPLPEPELAPGQSSTSFSDDRTMSPKEFMLEKKPLQDIERVACLAYYLTHYRDTPHFKTLDLSKLNTEAAQVKFSNAAKAADNATKAGLLVPASRGMKQISAKGELYVQGLPDRAAAKDAVSHFRQRRKVRRPRGSTGVANAMNGSDTEPASDE